MDVEDMLKSSSCGYDLILCLILCRKFSTTLYYCISSYTVESEYKNLNINTKLVEAYIYHSPYLGGCSCKSVNLKGARFKFTQ